MADQVIMVRVYLHEEDHGRRKASMDDILKALREQFSMNSVSVFRGIAGVGRDGIVHAADMMHFDVNLPLVIEFCEAPKLAEAAISMLAGMVPPAHIIFWSITRAGAV